MTHTTGLPSSISLHQLNRNATQPPPGKEAANHPHLPYHAECCVLPQHEGILQDLPKNQTEPPKVRFLQLPPHPTSNKESSGLTGTTERLTHAHPNSHPGVRQRWDHRTGSVVFRSPPTRAQYRNNRLSVVRESTGRLATGTSRAEAKQAGPDQRRALRGATRNRQPRESTGFAGTCPPGREAPTANQFRIPASHTSKPAWRCRHSCCDDARRQQSIRRSPYPRPPKPFGAGSASRPVHGAGDEPLRSVS